MNCEYAQAVIDAGSLADLPVADAESALLHAQSCPVCGPALATAAVLETRLAAMPRPTAPDLSGIVLTSIAGIDAERVSPSSVELGARSRKRDRMAWAALIAGVIPGVALTLSSFPSAAAGFSEAAVRGPASFATATMTIHNLMMGIGLLLFGFSLLIPVSLRRAEARRLRLP